MAGREHPRPRARDFTGIYAKRCDALADRLGFTRDSVWFWFDQLSCDREIHTKVPRDVAESMAWSDVEKIFDKAKTEQFPS